MTCEVCKDAKQIWQGWHARFVPCPHCSEDVQLEHGDSSSELSSGTGSEDSSATSTDNPSTGDTDGA